MNMNMNCRLDFLNKTKWKVERRLLNIECSYSDGKLCRFNGFIYSTVHDRQHNSNVKSEVK